MKIRVISDLHIDANTEIPLKYDDDIFTVICGDISEDATITSQWVSENIKHGIFVGGNHLTYSGRYSLKESQAILRKRFPLDESVSFLECSCKTVNDVLFVGGTLWTDFSLGADHKEPEKKLDAILHNMDYALFGMPDYLGSRYEGKQLLQPIHTLKIHAHTVNYIRKVVENFQDKKIVVVTHHAPSPLSTDSRYADDIQSPCYASDLTKLILNHSNIKLWCHGHIHQAKDYKIGTTRILCNPRGYEAKGETQTGWDKNLFVNL